MARPYRLETQRSNFITSALKTSRMRQVAQCRIVLTGNSRQGAVVVAVACLQRRQAQQAGQVPGVRVQRLPPQPPRHGHSLPLRLRRFAGTGGASATGVEPTAMLPDRVGLFRNLHSPRATSSSKGVLWAHCYPPNGLNCCECSFLESSFAASLLQITMNAASAGLPSSGVTIRQTWVWSGQRSCQR